MSDKPLNPQQQEAVNAIYGPVLVVAGPGTGKTEILSQRIAHILSETDAQPSNILCLTFTETGAAQMRKRLYKLIGQAAYQIKIETFHSFTNDVIRSYPEIFAFSTELEVLDDLTKVKIMRRLLDEHATRVQDSKLVPFNSRHYNQGNILSAIGTLKLEAISPERLDAAADAMLQELEADEKGKFNPRTKAPTGKWRDAQILALKSKELAQLYSRFQTEITEAGFYDYNDMINMVIDKFRTNPDLLADHWERYQFILVDEFQDTNGSQLELLKLLGSMDDSPNIFAVGDDDQAIFRFQGANVENLMLFKEKYPETQVIPITTNYRSSQAILDLAGSLISKNEGRLVEHIPGLNKELQAGTEIPGQTHDLYEFPSEEAENKFIAQKILELHEEGVLFEEMAVLYRYHRNSEDIVDTLLRAGIPVKLAAGGNVLESIRVKQLIDLLSAIEHTGEGRDRKLFEVLLFSFLGFSPTDVFKLTSYASTNKLSIYHVMTKRESLVAAGLQSTDPILEFAEKLAVWKQAANELSLSDFLDKVDEESGFIQSIFQGEPDPEVILAVTAFINYVREANRRNSELSLKQLLDDLRMMKENRIGISSDELELKKDAVNMMTIFKSKGMEFRYVFIPKFTHDNWKATKQGSGALKFPPGLRAEPSSILNVEDPDREEVRRLLFVAITRARERLFFSYSKGSGDKEQEPSEYLFELESQLNFVDGSGYAEFDPEWQQQKLGSLPEVDVEELMQEYLKQQVSSLRLSASSLNSYLGCPRQFMYERLIGVPSTDIPALAIGNAVHHALEHFMKHLMNGEEPDQDLLIFLAHKYLEDRVILTEEELKLYKAEATKLITGYYNEYAGTFKAPIAVEFTFGGRTVLEAANMDPIVLTGKIDKIEMLDESRNEVRVVDYKSGRVKTRNEILGATKSSEGDTYRQLQFYKLLSQLDPQFGPPSGGKYKIVEAVVDFIKPKDNGKYSRESFEIPDSEIDELKGLIIDVMHNIRELNFSGTEKYPVCGECDYCKSATLH